MNLESDESKECGGRNNWIELKKLETKFGINLSEVQKMLNITVCYGKPNSVLW
jgi:hypothetical protein